MTEPRLSRWLPAGRAALGIVVLTGLLGGCTTPTSRMQITSYKDPYFPEQYHVDLLDCTYQKAADGDYEIAGSAHAALAARTAARQFLRVHIFWKPWPGKTFSDSSGMDAVLEYVIVTDGGSVQYTGTGFAYPRKIRRDGTLVADIESARLSVRSLVGEAVEALGDMRLEGTLVARNDPNRTLDLRREMALYSTEPQEPPPPIVPAEE